MAIEGSILVALAASSEKNKAGELLVDFGLVNAACNNLGCDF